MPSSDLQLAVYGSTDITGPIALCPPCMQQVIISDLNTLKNHITVRSTSHSFIVLFLDLNNENANPCIEELRQQDNVLAVFIRFKRGTNFNFNARNVYPVAKQFIAQKILTTAIEFHERTSAYLLGLNHIIPANNLKRKANDLKYQRRSISTTINACHVLIIPLNVTEEHTLEFQERLINLCNNLCGDYEPQVYTLDAYLDPNENPDSYGNKGIFIKCNFIKKISWIRIYLIGNEVRNLHSFSQTLLENESINFHEDDYDKNHTLVEYEPVTEQTKQNLVNIFGGDLQQSTNIIIKRLDDIQNDIRFLPALDRVNANLQARAMVANVELNQQAVDESINSVEYSGAFHIIRQAQNGPSAQNIDANQEINNIIQRPFTPPSSD